MQNTSSSSSPRGISWHQPPRSGGSAGGGGGRRRGGVRPAAAAGGRRKVVSPSQLQHPQQQQYQDQQPQQQHDRRPRDEVLDSSSSSEDEGGRGECNGKDKSASTMSAGFDDIRRVDNNYWQGKDDRGDGDEGETGESSPASDDNADEDDDDEEQFMNPYVMKPHFLFNNNTPPQPPPPPSMELTSIMSWRSSSSTASTQATTNKSTISNNREKSSALMGFDPYSPGRDQTQQQQYQTQQHQQAHRHYPMQHEMEWEMEIEESTIDFTQQQPTQQQQQNQHTFFESKDDIDYLFHNSNPYREPNRNDQGGGEIGVRSSGENDDYLYDASFSASFSPVPKHHQQQLLGPQDYGEKTPLFGGASSSSSSSTSTQFPHHPFLPHRGPIFNAHTPFSSTASASSSSSSGQWRTRIRQNIPPLVVGASNAILSVLYYASRTASILLNGGGGEERNTSNTNHHHSSSSINNARMPLLSASRFPEKFRNNDSRRSHRRWNTIKSFRVLLIAMTAVLCMRTISIMMWSLPSDAEMSSSSTTTITTGVGIVPDAMTIAEQQQQQQQISEHQQNIVNKMKKAKAHWWSRKKIESSSTSSEKVVAPPAEVYRDGKKEDVQTIVVPEQTEVVVQGGNLNTKDANNESTMKDGGHSSAAAVIVQTEEDGTILIKLPPPKLSLEEEPNKSFGSAIIDDNEEEDERLYIKLPYQPQQQHQGEEMATEKREIEPPLRGAAPQETQHPQSSTLMRRRLPPPLLADHEHHHHPASHHHHGLGGNNRHLHDEHDHPNVLHALRKEFETWMSKHGKQYGSKKEEEHRFNVWRTNHARIAKKNDRHGPCRMTGKAVFGHNLFSDLDPEEFQSKFLTGYRGPRHSSSSSSIVGSGTIDAAAVLRQSYFRDTKRVAESPSPITGTSLIKRHPSIQRKLDEVITKYGAGGFEEEGSSSNNSQLHGTKFQSNYGSRCNTWWDISCYRNNGVKWSNGCQWWDVSCVLRYIFGYQYMGGTREPVYDESSYPSVLDWRTLGVVTDVNSQGACGACWAITAVETIESANAIATGQLIDLDEEEVIACDGTCEMCNGGWPQNAYEYVMKHGGLPVKTSDYNADWLYLVTAVLAGESYDVSQDQLSGYFAQTCPAGVREGDSGEARGDNKNGGDHHSGDEQQQQYASSYVASTRYGKVKGYGYATDRCVCYTDGSGCDCDNQDEKTAVLNVASYGPAAVCLEASLWQNYEGGIMTSDIGCSSGFLDMNHCVEVVGYAFTDEGSSSNGGGGGGGGGGSRDDKSHKSGSRDSSRREGYWIVKNQWSTYWGMGGYAYLAMGDNTCGILNDMTQVYMK